MKTLEGDRHAMLSALVPREHTRALDRLARQQGTTRSALVRAAIAQMVQKAPQRPQAAS